MRRLLFKSIRSLSPATDPPSPTLTAFKCPSCGHESRGDFCSQCGEKRIGDQDYSVRQFLAEALGAITLLESKVLRSVWLVISKPGFLSAEYFKGRRVRYMKPLQLFIFLNVVYYFSLTLFSASTFTTPLNTQLHMNNYYPSYAGHRVARKLEADHITYATLETKYDQRTNVLSRTLIFLLIPIFAVVFYAFFFRKHSYFVEHLVVATHFWSFSLILLGIVLPLFSLFLIWLLKTMSVSASLVTDDGVTSSVLQVCFGVYLFLMMRRAYAATRWYCAATSLVIGWSFFHIVWLYRFLLFEFTLRWV